MKAFLLSWCLVLCAVPVLVQAATRDFTIKWYGVDDTESPTVPTLVSAVPVSSDQIDLTWTAATDNYLLGGYVVRRDSVPIATTTLTTYSDTGLTASTTYTYSVVAFDSFNNVSSSSNTIATSTLAAPVTVSTTTDEARPVSATKTIVLEDFSTITATRSVMFTWETNMATRYVIRWGRTDLYDDGYIRNDTYKVEHGTEITALEPGTTYMYEITAYSPAGAAVVIKRGAVVTASLPGAVVVPNVSRLTVTAVGEDVRIAYELPAEVVVDSVRIVRNHIGYPTDSNDGAVVYDGIRTDYLDVAALQQHPTQFYSVFVVAASGVVSSGAVAAVTRVGAEELGGGDIPAASSTSSSTDDLDIPLTGLAVNNIMVTQLGREFTFLDTAVALSYKDSFTIKIPATALPKHLKSIVVTLLDPTNQRQSYSFMLRLNKDQTAYEATVAPLYVRGVSRLQIQIFDYDRMVVGLYRKQIDFIIPEEDDETEVIFPDALVSSARNTLWPGLFVLAISLGLMLFLAFRRQRKAEDNT